MRQITTKKLGLKHFNCGKLHTVNIQQLQHHIQLGRE